MEITDAVVACVIAVCVLIFYLGTMGVFDRRK